MHRLAKAINSTHHRTLAAHKILSPGLRSLLNHTENRGHFRAIRLLLNKPLKSRALARSEERRRHRRWRASSQRTVCLRGSNQKQHLGEQATADRLPPSAHQTPLHSFHSSRSIWTLVEDLKYRRRERGVLMSRNRPASRTPINVSCLSPRYQATTMKIPIRSRRRRNAENHRKCQDQGKMGNIKSQGRREENDVKFSRMRVTTRMKSTQVHRIAASRKSKTRLLTVVLACLRLVGAKQMPKSPRRMILLMSGRTLPVECHVK
mmetsp:Transcript_2699/g.8178  ORF Transcript_2699/g.8178 Transcript_2699/m.8178 type:complete len:263 (+) Transcript_2699:663-1451(+)